MNFLAHVLVFVFASESLYHSPQVHYHSALGAFFVETCQIACTLHRVLRSPWYYHLHPVVHCHWTWRVPLKLCSQEIESGKNAEFHPLEYLLRVFPVQAVLDHLGLYDQAVIELFQSLQHFLLSVCLGD